MGMHGHAWACMGMHGHAWHGMGLGKHALTWAWRGHDTGLGMLSPANEGRVLSYDQILRLGHGLEHRGAHLHHHIMTTWHGGMVAWGRAIGS